MTLPASPAQRYAAFRVRPAALTAFQSLYDFEFDPFQVEACQALYEGGGVLVAAPTGSGKTVVGEFAVHLALAGGRKCFYTTPIKALSNHRIERAVSFSGPPGSIVVPASTDVRELVRDWDSSPPAHRTATLRVRTGGRAGAASRGVRRTPWRRVGTTCRSRFMTSAGTPITWPPSART